MRYNTPMQQQIQQRNTIFGRAVLGSCAGVRVGSAQKLRTAGEAGAKLALGARGDSIEKCQVQREALPRQKKKTTVFKMDEMMYIPYENARMAKIKSGRNRTVITIITLLNTLLKRILLALRQ